MIFSQKAVLSDKGDTLICFSVEQSKFLLKKHYEAEECNKLNSACEKQLKVCDSVFVYKDKIIADKTIIIKNQKEEITLKDDQIEKLKESLQLEKQNTILQRNYKRIAIIGGVVGTSIFGYLWITK